MNKCAKCESFTASKIKYGEGVICLHCLTKLNDTTVNNPVAACAQCKGIFSVADMARGMFGLVCPTCAASIIAQAIGDVTK